MRSAGLIGGFAMLAVCAGCDRDRLSSSDIGSAEDVEVNGVQALRIGSVDYVLAGIDTPKPAPEAGCWAEALLARETRAALEGLVLSPYRLQASDPELLPSGETRARIEVNGRDLSDALLEDGLAAPSLGGEPFDWCGPVDQSQDRRPRLGYPAEVALKLAPGERDQRRP